MGHPSFYSIILGYHTTLPDTGYASPSTTAGTYVASASSGRRRNDENGFDVGDYEHRDKQGSSSNLDNHQLYILPTKLPSQGGKRYRVNKREILLVACGI